MKQPSVIRLATSEQTSALADVLWLCGHSPLHRRYPVHILHDRFLPSLAQRQYVMCKEEDGRPLGFCNWIYLPEKRMREIAGAKRDVQQSDWWIAAETGQEHQAELQLFFPEFLAPFGHCRQLVRYLRQQVFPRGTTGISIRGRIAMPGERALPKVKHFKA